jgi:hypothetical protein
VVEKLHKATLHMAALDMDMPMELAKDDLVLLLVDMELLEADRGWQVVCLPTPAGRTASVAHHTE